MRSYGSQITKQNFGPRVERPFEFEPRRFPHQLVAHEQLPVEDFFEEWDTIQPGGAIHFAAIGGGVARRREAKGGNTGQDGAEHGEFET